MGDNELLIGAVPSGGKTINMHKQIEICYNKTLIDKDLLNEILLILEENNTTGEYNILIGKIKLALNV